MTISNNERQMMNDEVVICWEKELENLFNSLMQRAFRGALFKND